MLSIAAHSDMFQPTANCSKPYKPYKFNSKYEVESYAEEVARYKRCIQDFVTTQRGEANNHLEAAKAAIDEWNRFVRTDLN